MKLLFSLILLILCQYIHSAVNYGFHNYSSLTQILEQFASSYPTKTHLYSIGKSVQNRDIWVLAIADSHPDLHISLRPEAKYIGGMHGNEAGSKEVLIHLIDYMLANQTSDPNVDFVMKNTRVHILVSLNPDGFEISYDNDCMGTNGKDNANNYSLNLNFPDLFECNKDPIQPETQSVINWLESNEFVYSANFFHDSAIVAYYPYDNISQNSSSNSIVYSATSDDDVFKYMVIHLNWLFQINKLIFSIFKASSYSFNHPTMRYSPCNGSKFVNGVINGGKIKLI